MRFFSIRNLFSTVIALLMLSSLSAAEDPAPPKKPEPASQKTCPVSGNKLGAMGDPVTVESNGRKILLCCPGCVKKFKADPDTYIKKVDAEINAATPAKTPVPAPAPKAEQTTCPVSGDKLGGDMGEAVLVEHNGRTVKLCCKDCVAKFKADPETYIKKVDAEIASATAAMPVKTPMPTPAPKADQTTCPVSGDKLGGDMGAPVTVEHNGRTIKLCCKDCVAKFKADPDTYIKKVDAEIAAATAATTPAPTTPKK